MFFPTSMISLMVTFRTFSFLDFLSDLQKSISVANNLLACSMFSVHVSAPNSKILWNKEYASVKLLGDQVWCQVERFSELLDGDGSNRSSYRNCQELTAVLFSSPSSTTY
jgi:hypothetical protein